MRRVLISALTLITVMAFFAACTSDDEKQNARLEVWLTDGPGDFQEVKIDVRGVEIHSSPNDNGEGWVSLDTEAGIYDVLKIANGEETLLSSMEVPAGRISQIRLVLGENNTVVVDGTESGMTIPSGSQSGLKLQVHETLAEGVVYKITLDFDVARSIVQTGGGAHILKPVIRLISEAQTGAIKGIVDPAASTPAIYAIAGEDTVGTTYTDEAGNFLLRGIPAGTYTVTFEPNENYSKHQVDNVAVETGIVTDVQTVTLTEN